MKFGITNHLLAKCRRAEALPSGGKTITEKRNFKKKVKRGDFIQII